MAHNSTCSVETMPIALWKPSNQTPYSVRMTPPTVPMLEEKFTEASMLRLHVDVGGGCHVTNEVWKPRSDVKPESCFRADWEFLASKTCLAKAKLLLRVVLNGVQQSLKTSEFRRFQSCQRKVAKKVFHGM
ncbi:hypothetical protein V6N12_013040 [Hibiscus sabdariffa]|uniref:Uncharacterized protein n=1 Tax=Hibiscus sabdariffa TaxID=183260 RepID=A0ABR2EG65_9ROSI